MKEHLFISYATEDGHLAEWLTLRLTAEGYLVWCDRFKLLGGESYPSDIDEAIRNGTFRFLALMSRASVAKANPKKERTLALNLSKARGERDFVVPLNVDGLRAEDLDWMTSDLTFIPFHPSWAVGLEGLVKKLDSISAPRPLPHGRTVVQEITRARSSLVARPERLWTNLLPIERLPSVIRRLRARKQDGSPGPTVVGVWHEEALWTFETPPKGERFEMAEDLDLESVRNARRKQNNDPVMDIVKQLIVRHVAARCREMGMLETDDQLLYFPLGLMPSNHLAYTNYKGRRTYVNAVGNRVFRTVGGTTVSRYHLAVEARPRLFQYGGHCLEVQMRVHVTDGSGGALDPKARLRRRKKICKSWWNHQWLARLLATLEWLGKGQENLIWGEGKTQLVISLKPCNMNAEVGIDETNVTKVPAAGLAQDDVGSRDGSEVDEDEGILEDVSDPDEAEGDGEADE